MSKTLFVLLVFSSARSFASDPPAPTGAHPRLFMSSAQLAAYQAKLNDPEVEHLGDGGAVPRHDR